ncbi:MAG: hypothetical protein KDB00_25515 [Planctomycetales bacterium]|nr:hypothetical protein [Planctomycetales bacterium]
MPQAIRATVRPYGTIEERALLKLRAKRSGREIWAAKYERCYANASHADDVKAGFEAAYVETALGMGNCPPPVPTRQSLALHGINRSYPCAVQWYEGYSLGHASAVANGVDRWRLAPLNPGLAVEQCHCQTQSLLTDQSIEHVITPELLESPVDSEPSVESLPAPDGMAPFLLEEFR